jgi:hypothetical protein
LSRGVVWRDSVPRCGIQARFGRRASSSAVKMGTSAVDYGLDYVSLRGSEVEAFDPAMTMWEAPTITMWEAGHDGLGRIASPPNSVSRPSRISTGRFHAVSQVGLDGAD